MVERSEAHHLAVSDRSMFGCTSLNPAYNLSKLPADLPLRIRIHQRADHALIRHAAFLGFTLEEIEAAARQRQRHLDVLLARHEVGGRGEEILDYPDATDFSRGVF